MAPDPTTPTTPQPETPSRSKFRVRFRKAGDLRLVSHHDLMHVFERMFRRADLPIPTSQGFNPRPRMWFALSLALGVAGLAEVLEFETSEPLPAEDVERRLTAQCPPGIEITSLRQIDTRASAHVRRAHYRVAKPAGEAHPTAEMRESFLQKTEHWAERLRPQPRRVNIRPYVDEITLTEDQVTMALWITPNGAARPEEVVAAVGLQGWLDAGAVIERTDLEIYDELPPDVSRPPVIRAVQQESSSSETTSPEPVRPTAIFDSPFSFDS